MFSFFIENAIDAIWCSPNANMQSIIEPARLTADGGAWNTFSLPWRVITLPEQGPLFHVYMIGQINPYLLGLLAATEHWVTFASTCNKKKMIIDIYANSGVQMPRTQVWYMVTKDKDLIIAVKQQKTIPIHFDNNGLFVRFYTNAFFQTPAAEVVTNGVNVQGGPLISSAAILALQNQYNASKLLPGMTYAFINGMLASTISLTNVNIGDVVEFVYDSSIYKQVQFTVGNLASFQSTLDNEFKYLLHYPSLDNSEGIEYQGDIDFFVTLPTSSNAYTGVYYHRNQVDAVRMLTHKDYSIPVAYITGYASDQPTWTNPNALVILMNVRHSGYTRTLPDENNRIKDLYKMSDADVAAAMTGVNAVMPNWQAANLEAAAYPAAMRANLNQLTLQLVQNAYGYNALSKILGNTPSFVTPYSTELIVQTPPGLISSSMAYEYDVNGILIGNYKNTTGSTYTAVNSNTKLVEMIFGNGTTQLDETYGAHTQSLSPTADYRMYTCPIEGGVPTNVWTDVTGGGGYSIINNVLTWLINTSQFYTMVRSNKTFLSYNLSMRPFNGLLSFSLSSLQLRNGTQVTENMQVPMGELDLFLNGYSLIENIDYFVNFPEIVIINKEFLINPLTQTQKIGIRFTGFCNSNFGRTLSPDIGFVKYGLLDYNGPYYEHGDKVVRIVVGGSLMDRSQIQDAENDPGTALPTTMNGKPYLIRDMIIPLQGTVVSDTYTLKALSLAIDQNVSNYLTEKIPKPNYTGPDTIISLYRVYSPFICKIIYDLISGAFNPSFIDATYNTQDVVNACQPYQYLLAYDPTQPNLQSDPNFVVVDPTNVMTPLAVNIYQYKFINLVAQTYMPNAFSLSQFLSITT